MTKSQTEKSGYAPHVSLIIPTYNERESIVGCIYRIETVMSDQSWTYEIIVIDDMSPDGTLTAVRRLQRSDPRIRSFSHSGQRDLGKSIYAGVTRARGYIIVGMDSDENHDAATIPLLLESLNWADLSVGSRYITGGGMENEFRYGASKWFNILLRVCFGFPIHDNTSGFYAIRKSHLLALDPSQIYYGYGEYHLRLIYRAMMSGLRITEIPVYYRNRLYGQSKSKLFTMVSIYLRTAFALHRGSA